MTEIKPMPCGGRIAVGTPGYSPCDDCQGIRHPCGAAQCPKADTPTAAPVRAPAEPRGDRFAEFEAWMIANGAGEKYARDTLKGARRCIQAGVTSSADVSSETLPGLARSSLAIYRNALKKFEGFLAETARPTPQTAAVVPETVAAMPEVEEAPEPTPAPQERAESIAPLGEVIASEEELVKIADAIGCDVEDLRPVEEPAEAAVDAADELHAAASNGRETVLLLREILLELRRQKVYRIKLTGECLVFEEAPTL